MANVALERQIRPIYDSLDSGSNKSALQGCNKVLKKYPHIDLVKALKALALVRMGKVEESLPLCDEVLGAKPTDLETLNVMMNVLRGLGRLTDLVSMYDEAFRSHPANEELATQDFFANVRTGNWKSAQQIATKMHKTFKDERYVYWSVLSALLQANEPGTPETTATILHKLASRLLASVDAPPHSTADRLFVHLTVLRALGELRAAAALLDTPEGQAVAQTSLTVDELRREIVRASGPGALVAEGARAERVLVEEKEFNWVDFLAVLDAAFSPSSPADGDSDADADANANASKPDIARVASARKLFATLAEEDGTRERAPLLALLDVEKRAAQCGLAEDFSADNGLLGLLKLYLSRFGDKACCFDDLKPYVQLDGEQLTQWVAHLDSLGHDTSSPSSLQRTINVHKIRRFLLTSEELTVQQEQTRAFFYLREYLDALALGKDLPATELQPADDLVLLVAQSMVSLWKLTNDTTWLYMASTVLEYAALKSKQSYLIRLHLIRIYRLIGAPSLSLHHYRLMNVKQVQNDTLSHFILARASTFSLASNEDFTYTQECEQASSIYIANSTETADFIVRAFGSEKYSQVADFVDFEDRLDNSLQRDLVKFEHVRMRLALEAASSDIVDNELLELKFIFDRLHHDNRDFEVLPNYQPRVSQSFNDQTLAMGSSPGLGWLMSFLRIYIRVFQLASDMVEGVQEKLIIGDPPKISNSPENQVPMEERLAMRKEKDLAELTPEEISLFDFSMALCDWMAPYHDYARPPPETVLAEAVKQLEQKAGKPVKVPSHPGNGSAGANGNGHKKEDPPRIQDAPELLSKFFDDMTDRFKFAVEEERSTCQLLHVVAVTEEAALLFAVATCRFKSAAVLKANKLSALAQSFKTIRNKATSVLKSMSEELSKLGAQEGTSENRKRFVEACKLLEELPELEHDFVMDVAKKVTDSRKRILDGLGKGTAKLCSRFP